MRRNTPVEVDATAWLATAWTDGASLAPPGGERQRACKHLPERPTRTRQVPVDVWQMLFSNIDDGYLEGLLRGYRAGILTSTDYADLCQCETIDGK